MSALTSLLPDLLLGADMALQSVLAARREGVIEGLERALEFSNSSVDRMDIRAEIERLRGEKL